ncbi:hypothetical protein ACLOJK_010643 [Asimina triloba]
MASRNPRGSHKKHSQGGKQGGPESQSTIMEELRALGSSFLEGHANSSCQLHSPRRYPQHFNPLSYREIEINEEKQLAYTPAKFRAAEKAERKKDAMRIEEPSTSGDMISLIKSELSRLGLGRSSKSGKVREAEAQAGRHDLLKNSQ